VIALVAVLILGFAIALPPARNSASPSGLSSLKTAYGPSGLDCSSSSTATLSIISPIPATGLAGTQIELEGSGFNSPGTSTFVIIYIVPVGGTGLTYEGSVYGVTLAPFTAYMNFPGDDDAINPPGEYTFWGDNGEQPANCASTSNFLLTANTPPSLYCLSWGASLTVTSPLSGSGGARSSVTIHGQGFYYVGATSIYWSSIDGTPSTQLTGVVSSAPYGEFNVTETVPSGYVPGTNVFWANDTLGDCAGVLFTLTAPPFALYPTSGPPGSVVAAAGTGFGPDEPIEFTLDSEYAASDCWTDGTGSFPGTSGTPCTFTVPEAPNGDDGGQNVIAVDTSLDRATASFDVTPEITLTPNQGPVGATFTVNGSGFSVFPSAAVVDFDGSEFAPTGGSDCNYLGPRITLDLNGGFNCTFKVPTTATPGANLVQGDDTGSGDLTAAQVFTLTIPTVTMSALGGLPGDSLVLRGTWFTPGHAVTPWFGATAYSCAKAKVTVQSDGSFTCTLTVPSVAPGSYKVSVSTPVQSNVYTAKDYTVLSQAKLTLSAYSGLPGDSLVLTGTGFTPGHAVTPWFGSTAYTCAKATVTVQKDGSFTCTLTVPSVAPGSYKVSVSTPVQSNVYTAKDYTVLSQAKLTLSAYSGLPGDSLVLTGTGFTPGHAVTPWFGSTAYTCAKATVTVQKDGSFTCTLTVPSVAPGSYTISVSTAVQSNVYATKTYTVI